jgi:hypothetical protein
MLSRSPRKACFQGAGAGVEVEDVEAIVRVA